MKKVSVDKPSQDALDYERIRARRPSVMFLNRSYWPDAEATGQLLTELCEDLAKDFDVTVVVGQPNHNLEDVQFAHTGSQIRAGVRICRVWNSRLSKSNLLGRAINYLSFLFTAAIASFRLPAHDIVVAESDPPLLCFVAIAIRYWHRSKMIMYLQDIYPDLAVALGRLPNNPPTKLLRRLMFGIYRRADRVIVLSRDMQQLLERSGVVAERIRCIPNWIDTKLVRPVKVGNAFRHAQGVDDHFVVMYSGNLGLCQRLGDVIEAADLLRDRNGYRDPACRRRSEPRKTKSRGAASPTD